MDQETYSLWASIISGKPFGATMQINSYFSLGQLVAVVALIIAFIQLIKPIINFRLKAWRINTKRLIVIVSFSIISVFIAAILPFVPHIPLPVIGYPIFWEASSAVLLVLYATVIITKMLKTPIFNKKNAQSYFEGCYDLIAKGNQEILNELANEVRPSIEPLFDECGKFNPDLARQAEKQGDEYDVSIDIRIGYTLLDLFSDKLFCKAIITRAPKTAFAIFDSLKKRPTRKMGYSLSQELINQAFVNEDSILIREEKYSGLGIFKHFMLTVYGDWDFVNGLHGPLSAWRYYRNDNGVQQWQIKKYCECLAV
ncbi:MAG: hypothetical protein KJ576_20820, partial [Proteobacteria bacterium]|nr:hypothetical protein [Pseudomonadota bacterium]